MKRTKAETYSMEMRTAVANMITNYIEAKGLTQNEFGKKFGISGSHICQIIKCKHNLTLDTVAFYSKACKAQPTLIIQ